MKRGMVYEIRSVARKLPRPDRDLTEQEAEELKRLETAFIRKAHTLGVRVSLKLVFPYVAPAPEKGSGT